MKLGCHDIDSETFPLLISGYLREAEKECRLNIPNDIKKEASNYCVKYKIYGMGGNLSRQFGLGQKVYGNYLDKNGHPTNKYLWQRLVELENLCPNVNSLFIEHGSFKTVTDLGEIYVTGDNTSARLGATTDCWSMKKSDLKPDFTKIANIKSDGICNNLSFPTILSIGHKRTQHSFIYTNNHQLYASGNNVNGVFGTGNKAIYKTKILHQKISTHFIQHKYDYIVDIKCGVKHSIFLTKFGNVYCCGSSQYGQCGQIGGQVLFPSLIPMDNKAIKIRCGENNNLIIDEMNQLFGFGANGDGQLGFENEDGIAYYHNPMINPYFERNNISISDVVCGPKHSLALDINGNCYKFGLMQSWINISSSSTPNKLDLYDQNECKTKSKEYAVKIATGTAHFGILSSLNRLICMGFNNHNQCSMLIEDRVIYHPYFVSKSYEIGIKEDDYIQDIFCESNNTIIIINPNKKAPIITSLLNQRMHDFESKKCKYNKCNLETVASEFEMRWVAEFGDEFVEQHKNAEIIEDSNEFTTYPKTELWTFQNAFNWARESVQFSFDKPNSNNCIDQNIQKNQADATSTNSQEIKETIGFTFDSDFASFSWDKETNKTDSGLNKFSWNF